MKDVPDTTTLKREGHHVPESLCTQCGATLNGAFATNHPGNPPPSPGDVTMCTGCGNTMVFAEDLSLRQPTSEEYAELISDPNWLQAQAAIARKIYGRRQH